MKKYKSFSVLILTNMNKIAIETGKAPKPVGAYSQAILESFKYKLELSGQIGINPETKELVEGIENQTKQALVNVAYILWELGWEFSNIIKSRIYLTDMSYYKTVDKIYASKFKDKPPSRVVVGVSELPKKALVEIECVAGEDWIEEGIKRKYNLPE